MKRVLVWGCALLCAGALGVVGQGQPASTSSGEPASRPLYRDPIYDAPTDPVLCFNGEAGTWTMYYTARRATADNAPGVQWVHGSQIGMAES